MMIGGRPMSRIEKDEAREHRITMEAIVDTYTEEEQALGWYYYVEGKLHIPFKARCIAKRRISPLKVDEEVEVVGMASEADCMHEIFVEINLFGRTFGVPLSQLKGIDVDSETHEAIEDWHYWVGRGHLY